MKRQPATQRRQGRKIWDKLTDILKVFISAFLLLVVFRAALNVMGINGYLTRIIVQAIGLTTIYFGVLLDMTQGD